MEAEEAAKLRELTFAALPQVGSVWVWEPDLPHARSQCTVTEVKWNSEEYWVESENAQGQRYWNELSRWVEATVMVSPQPDENPSNPPRQNP